MIIELLAAVGAFSLLLAIVFLAFWLAAATDSLTDRREFRGEYDKDPDRRP